MRLPGRGIDDAPAPTIFDKEARGGVDVEGGHMVVGMASKCIGDPAFVQLGEVITLTDIVETADLDHEMMQGLLSRAHHGEAMMAAVNVEEVETVWLQPEIRNLESEQVAIERQQTLDILDIENRVPHSERAGAKARDRTSGPERLGRESRL